MRKWEWSLADRLAWAWGVRASQGAGWWALPNAIQILIFLYELDFVN
jgi:hypothetical protein